MPLGVVSDDEFESELKNSRVELDKSGVPVIGSDLTKPTKDEDKGMTYGGDLPTVAEIQEMRIGRGQGNNEVPESLRKIIAQTNLESGRAAAISLAYSFGISESSVSAYLNGSTSTATYNNKDKELNSFIGNLKKKGARRAGLKLLKALDNITEEKLEEAPAGVLASIAKSLSGVVKDLEPEVAQGPVMGAGVQFVVFAPQIVQESKFPVIELQE